MIINFLMVVLFALLLATYLNEQLEFKGFEI